MSYVFSRRWLKEAEEAEEAEGVGVVEAGEEGYKTLMFKTRQFRTLKPQTLLHHKTHLAREDPDLGRKGRTGVHQFLLHCQLHRSFRPSLLPWQQ